MEVGESRRGGGSKSVAERSLTQERTAQIASMTFVAFGSTPVVHKLSSTDFLSQYKNKGALRERGELIGQALAGGESNEDIAKFVASEEADMVGLACSAGPVLFKENPLFFVYCVKALLRNEPSIAKEFAIQAMRQSQSDILRFELYPLVREAGVEVPVFSCEEMASAFEKRKEREFLDPFLVCEMLRGKGPEGALDLFEELPDETKNNDVVLYCLFRELRLSAVCSQTHPGSEQKSRSLWNLEEGMSGPECLEETEVSMSEELVSSLHETRRGLLFRLFPSLPEEKRAIPLVACEMQGRISLSLMNGFLWQKLVEHLPPLRKDNIQVRSQAYLYFYGVFPHCPEGDIRKQIFCEKGLQEFLGRKGLLDPGGGYWGFSGDRTHRMELSPDDLLYRCYEAAKEGEWSGFALKAIGDLGKIDMDVYSVNILICQVRSKDLLKVAETLPPRYMSTIPVALTFIDQARVGDILRLFDLFPDCVRTDDHVICRAISRVDLREVGNFCEKLAGFPQVSDTLKKAILMRLKGESLDAFMEKSGFGWVDSKDLAFLLLRRAPLSRVFDMYCQLGQDLREEPYLVMQLLSRLHNDAGQRGDAPDLEQIRGRFWETLGGKIIESIDLGLLLVEHAPEGKLLAVLKGLSSEVRSNFEISLKIASRVSPDNVSWVWELLPVQHRGNLVLLKMVLLGSKLCKEALSIYEELPESSKEELSPWFCDRIGVL